MGRRSTQFPVWFRTDQKRNHGTNRENCSTKPNGHAGRFNRTSPVPSIRIIQLDNSHKLHCRWRGHPESFLIETYEDFENQIFCRNNITVSHTGARNSFNHLSRRQTLEISNTLVLKNPTKEVIEEPASQTFDRLLRESFDLRFKESQSILPIENIISKSKFPQPSGI